MKRKIKKNGIEEYRTTLILLTILMAVMSLIIFMPLKHSKQADVNSATVSTR
jgi:preprotein translocase subunit SecG